MECEILRSPMISYRSLLYSTTILYDKPHAATPATVCASESAIAIFCYIIILSVVLVWTLNNWPTVIIQLNTYYFFSA